MLRTNLPFTLPTFDLKVVERQRDAKSLAELSSTTAVEVQGLSPKRNAFVVKITHYSSCREQCTRHREGGCPQTARWPSLKTVGASV